MTKKNASFGLWKVYALMICCVFTAGLISALVSGQTKVVINRYFASDENPAKKFLTPSLQKNFDPVTSKLIPSKERDEAIAVASNKVDRIKMLGVFVDAAAQLTSIFIYAFFLFRHFDKRILK